MSSRTVVIQWAEPESDQLFSVRLRVYAGCPMRGPTMHDPGSPAEDPEVEILSVRDEKHEARPDVAALLESDFMDEIEEAALQEAAEVERDEQEMQAEWAAESRREAARERASELRGVMAAILPTRVA